MVAVFFTFALSGPLPPKEMGVILGVAVLLDALVVRLLAGSGRAPARRTLGLVAPRVARACFPRSGSATDGDGPPTGDRRPAFGARTSATTPPTPIGPSRPSPGRARSITHSPRW